MCLAKFGSFVGGTMVGVQVDADGQIRSSEVREAWRVGMEGLVMWTNRGCERGMETSAAQGLQMKQKRLCCL